MLTHWDTLSVSSGLGVQKAAMGPVSKREVGVQGRANQGQNSYWREGICMLSVSTYRDFLIAHVRETKQLWVKTVPCSAAKQEIREGSAKTNEPEGGWCIQNVWEIVLQNILNYRFCVCHCGLRLMQGHLWDIF